MGVIENHYLQNLKSTDNLINIENTERLSGSLAKIIKSIILTCDSLFDEQYSLFITGSLAICLRSKSLKEFRTTGDKSDIDLWIITDKLTQKTSKTSDYEKEIIKGFGRLNSFDISCVPFHDDRFKMSLKIMNSTTVKKILRLNKNVFKVFRSNSLKKNKTRDIFYGFKGKYNISIFEDRIENGGFLWYWSANPFIKKDFVLTDIHSCFLIGGFLIDNLKLEKRLRYLKKLDFYFKKYTNDTYNKQFKILRYFYERFPSSATKIFGKEEGADSFTENAP